MSGADPPLSPPRSELYNRFDKSNRRVGASSSLAGGLRPYHPPASLSNATSLPSEVLGRVESFLAPSDCAHLSATCVSFKQRWTTTRWRLTFLLHFGKGLKRANSSFVGCCCDGCKCAYFGGCGDDAQAAVAEQARGRGRGGGPRKRCDSSSSWGSAGRAARTGDRMSAPLPTRTASSAATSSSSRTAPSTTTTCECPHAECLYSNITTGYGGSGNGNSNGNADKTQFNVAALIPSVRKAYCSLWDTIELAMLGYYDAGYNAFADDRIIGHNDRNIIPPIPNVAIPTAAGATATTTAAHANFHANTTTTASIAPGNIDDINNNLPTTTRFTAAADTKSAFSDLMDYFLFIIGLKPLLRRRQRTRKKKRLADLMCNKNVDNDGSATTGGGGNSNRRRFDPLLALRSSTTSMSAWKLACILKERGVDCIRCSICNQIDLGGHTVPHTTWIRPCNCPELVHRRCLEHRLGMMTRLTPFFQRRNRMWISYDDAHNDIITLIVNNNNNNNNNNNLNRNVGMSINAAATTNASHSSISGNANVNEQNELTHAMAQCETCLMRYCRSVRLPSSKAEVVLASLSDPLSLIRALSTFLHFLLCCILISATEGICCGVDGGGEGNIHTDAAHGQGDNGAEGNWFHGSSALSNYQGRMSLGFFSLILKWPARGGLALAWWQLQQCCMLHIFFSPRFAAMVDRLWMGPIRYFYCRLYLYFLFTSAILAISYLPFFGRVVKERMLALFLSQGVLRALSPLLNLLAFLNLAQYAVVSTMVVCIFWRTNFRIFTIADRREEAAWEWEARRNTHPIYHGQWQ